MSSEIDFYPRLSMESPDHVTLFKAREGSPWFTHGCGEGVGQVKAPEELHRINSY
jgi:hypothetical protein